MPYIFAAVMTFVVKVLTFVVTVMTFVVTVMTASLRNVQIKTCINLFVVH